MEGKNSKQKQYPPPPPAISINSVLKPLKPIDASKSHTTDKKKEENAQERGDDIIDLIQDDEAEIGPIDDEDEEDFDQNNAGSALNGDI
mmetsp:Transcript_13126/g.20388  ORF Transcript_13126/g.20388 Transcript_13126/m.20388 type:complete len:89 (-) Transcript_13126:2266-2532(-)